MTEKPCTAKVSTQEDVQIDLSSDVPRLQKVPLSTYFDIVAPKQDDKINFTLSRDIDAVPFLGRSSSNNGIVDYVAPRADLINNGGQITIALDGSTGATFYQYHSFSSGQNIWILKPRSKFITKMTPAIALFLVTTIRIAVKNYTYNLSLTKTRLKKINIYLPLRSDDTLDVEHIENRMNGLRNIDLISSIPNSKHV